MNVIKKWHLYYVYIFKIIFCFLILLLFCLLIDLVKLRNMLYITLNNFIPTMLNPCHMASKKVSVDIREQIAKKK